MKKSILVFIFLHIYSIVFAQSTLEKGQPPVLKNEKISETDSLQALARTFYNKGIISFQLNRNEDAIENFKKAIEIRKIFPDSISLFPNAKGYHNIGNSWRKLNQYDVAIESFENALGLFNKLRNEERISRTSKDAGWVYAQLGDINKARLYLYRARNFYRDSLHLPRYVSRLTDTHANLIEFYRLQGVTDSMKHYAFKAQQLNEDINLREIANSYNNLAIAYEMEDSLQLAEDYYLKALDIYHNSKDTLNMARCNNNLGVLFRKKKRQNKAQKKELHDKAIQYIDKALELNKATGRKDLQVINWNNKGNCFFESGEYGRGFLFKDSAILSLIKRYNPDRPSDLPNIQTSLVRNKLTLMRILNEKTTGYNALGDFGSLSIAIEIADYNSNLIDNLRRSYQSEISKGFLAGEAKAVFENAIQTAYQLHQYFSENNQEDRAAQMLDRAFVFFEKSKAIILLEAVKKSQFEFRIDSTETALLDSIKQERNLKRRIAKLEKQKKSHPDSTAKYLTYTKRLNQLIGSLEKQLPEYSALKYPKVIPVKMVQEQLLADNQAMIEYFVGEKKLYIFYLDKHQKFIETVPLNDSFPLEKWVNRLVEEGRDGRTSAINTLLYNKLVPQPDKIARRLIIIPDDVLGLIDFGTLINSSPKEEDCPFWICEHPLSYCYSATMLEQMKNMKLREDRLTYIGIAPFYDEEDLVNSEQEVLSWQESFGGKVFIDPAATLDNFKNMIKRNSARILLFAAHAKANMDHPDSSYIAFSKYEKLLLKDLYDMELNADLVILSACETGRGKVAKGEGIISLARGVAYGKAKSILMTLWDVYDEGIYNLDIAFKKKLKAGKTKDEALWEVQREIIQREGTEEITLWAGVLQVGDTQKISQGSFWAKWIVYLIASALFFFLIWRRRK